MEKFSNNFNFEETYKKLSSVNLIDPQTVVVEGRYIPVNKQSSKVLNTNYGMRSLQFSNQLYQHDDQLWNELLTKKKNLSVTQDYKDSHYAVIIDDTVVSILDNDKSISEFMKVISNYTADDSFDFYYNYANDEFQFIVIKKDNKKSGFIIRYYLSYNWITVNGIYLVNNKLFISPNPITDKEVEDDLELVLNKDELLAVSDLTYVEYENFIKKSSEYMISMEELFSYLKNDFGIKIKYQRIDPFDYLASHEYNSEVSSFVSDVLTYIYDTDKYRFINSPYLKKSIEFSKYSFKDYFEVLADLYFDNQVDINSLIHLISYITYNKANYCQINS